MNWSILKDFKCPYCSRDIEVYQLRFVAGYKCSDTDCDFTIIDKKFVEIISRSSLKKTKKYEHIEDNLEALNNL